MRELKIENWGEIEYSEGLNLQLKYVEERSTQLRGDTLVICSHPSVVTLGRGTKEGDVLDWAGPIVPVQRGGRATYHGPGQVVIYPIIDLSSWSHTPRDIHFFLRTLEQVIIDAVQVLGISGSRKEEATGVWVGEKKIASLGIAVKKWVTYHGVALNYYRDTRAFQGLKPCGFKQDTMTSIEELLEEDSGSLLSSAQWVQGHLIPALKNRI